MHVFNFSPQNSDNSTLESTSTMSCRVYCDEFSDSMLMWWKIPARQYTRPLFFFLSLLVLAPKDTKFGKIMQNTSHYAIQGHWFGAIWKIVWILGLLTYIMSGTVSKLLRIIGQICAFHGDVSITHV